MIRALDTYIKVSNDSTKIVPGHGPLATKADLVTFHNMLVTSHDRGSVHRVSAYHRADGRSLGQT